MFKKIMPIFVLVLLMCSMVSASPNVLLSPEEIQDKQPFWDKITSFIDSIGGQVTYYDSVTKLFQCEDTVTSQSGTAFAGEPAVQVTCNSDRCNLNLYELGTYKFVLTKKLVYGQTFPVENYIFELYDCVPTTWQCSPFLEDKCGASAPDGSVSCEYYEMLTYDVCTSPERITRYFCVSQPECRDICSVDSDCEFDEYCESTGCVSVTCGSGYEVKEHKCVAVEEPTTTTTTPDTTTTTDPTTTTPGREEMEIVDGSVVIKECLTRERCVFNPGESITVSLDVKNYGDRVINDWIVEAGVYPDDWLVENDWGTSATFEMFSAFAFEQQEESCQGEPFVGRAVISNLAPGLTKTVTLTFRVPQEGDVFADGTSAWTFSDDSVYPHKSYQIGGLVANQCWSEGITDFVSDTSVLAGSETGTNVMIRECISDADCNIAEPVCSSQDVCVAPGMEGFAGIPRDEVKSASTLTLLNNLCEFDGKSTGTCQSGSRCSSISALLKAGDIDDVEADGILRSIEHGLQDESVLGAVSSDVRAGFRTVIAIGTLGVSELAVKLYESFAGQTEEDKLKSTAICVVEGEGFNLLKWFEDLTGLSGGVAIIILIFSGLGLGYLALILINPKKPNVRSVRTVRRGGLF